MFYTQRQILQSGLGSSLPRAPATQKPPNVLITSLAREKGKILRAYWPHGLSTEAIVAEPVHVV